MSVLLIAFMPYISPLFHDKRPVFLSPSTMQRIHSIVPRLREPVFIKDDISRAAALLSNEIEYSFDCSDAKKDNVISAAKDLMSNSLKYAGNGLLSLYGNHRRIYLLMEDQGPGLEAPILKEAIHSPGLAGPHTLGRGLHRISVASDKMAFYRDSNLTAIAAIFFLPQQRHDCHAGGKRKDREPKR